MAANLNLPYRLVFYYRNTNEIAIRESPLTREQAIQAVKDEYDPNDENTDVFVAVLPIPSEPDCYARDEEATKIARQDSEAESDDDTITSSSASTSPPTPPLPDSPAAQAALFFPVQANESDSQRQERADAETLFTTYPLTAQNLWKRFHKPTVVESTMFDIWETGRRPTQGPEAARDMVRTNINRMKSGNTWELQAMEDLF